MSFHLHGLPEYAKDILSNDQWQIGQMKAHQAKWPMYVLAQMYATCTMYVTNHANKTWWT